MTTKNCPECGSALNDNSPFCPVCGHNLSVDKEARTLRLLLFGTPLAVFPVCLLAAWEVGLHDYLLVGANLGTWAVILYFFAALLQWSVSKAIGRIASAYDAWLAGLYSLFSISLTALVGMPLEYLYAGRIKGLSLDDEEMLGWGIYFCIYIILLTAGVVAIALKSSRRPISVHLELGAGRSAEVELMIQEQPMHQIRNKLKVLLAIVAISFVAAAIEYNLLSASARLLVHGKLAAMMGRLDKALAYVDEAVAKDPHNAEAYYLRGQLKLMNVGAKAAPLALEDFKRAIDLASDSMRYRCALCEAFLTFGDANAAMKLASESIEVNALEPRAWILLGNAAIMLQDYRQAVNAYKKAYELEPKNPAVINNLAFSLLEANEDLPWALELARRSVELQPGMAYNTDTLAWALFKNGRPNDALELLLQIREQMATLTAEIAFHYAAVLHELGMLPDPKTTFSKLLEEAETQKIPGLSENIRNVLKSLPASSATLEDASSTLSDKLPPANEILPSFENASEEVKEGP